ncbi:MAG: glycosyltransferase, partial [Lachnospiraceae bacterium]|nr:glycosyltransferase [Lachnospiraceae bacterium]
MIKILVDGLPTGVGGIGTAIFNLLKNVDLKEYSITFLLTYDSYYVETIIKYKFNYIKIAPFGKKPITYAWQLYKHLKSQRYDYIWINNTSKVNLLLPLLAKSINNARIVWHAHGVDCEYSGIKRRIVKIIEYLNESYFYKLVDTYIACSKQVASCCYKNIGLRYVTIIYNPIDINKFLFNYSDR